MINFILTDGFIDSLYTIFRLTRSRRRRQQQQQARFRFFMLNWVNFSQYRDKSEREKWEEIFQLPYTQGITHIYGVEEREKKE